MPYNKPPGFTQPRQPQAYQPPPPPQAAPSSQNSSVEELVKAMAVTQSKLQQNTQALQQSQIDFQNNTQASLNNLETQVSQLARELSETRVWQVTLTNHCESSRKCNCYNFEEW